MAIKKTVADLTLKFDAGSSKSKCLAHGKEPSAEICILMDPEAIAVDEYVINEHRLQSDEEVEGREARAFVSSGGKYWAIGRLAQYNFYAVPALGDRKQDRLPEKIAAAIWVAAERLGVGKIVQKGEANAKIPTRVLSLKLSCLLPGGEFKDAANLKNKIVELLLDFDTPTGRYSVQVMDFKCHPEGLGIVRGHLEWRKRNRPIEDGKILGLIMMGDRDGTIFRVDPETKDINGYKPSKYGFNLVAKEIEGETSGYNIRQITAGVAPYLLTGQEKYLENDLLLRRSDLDRDILLAAINRAKGIYLEAIFGWFEEALKGVDEVIVAGGTAQLFANEIAEYFGDRLPKIPGSSRPAVYLNGCLRIPDNSPIPQIWRARCLDVANLR